MVSLDFLKDFVVSVESVVYDDGVVHNAELIDDGKGGYTRNPDANSPCKARIDRVTEYMRLEEGFTDKDVGLFILQTPGLVVDEDSELTLNGVRYTLGTLRQDPLQAAWQVRGTPVDG